MAKTFTFTCSRCDGRVESNAKPDRIAGKPTCAPCFWGPATAAAPEPPASPAPAVLAFPCVASFGEMDPDERRSFARRAA